MQDEEEAALIVEDNAVWNARVDAKTAARACGSLRLALDTSQLSFFDADTGESLTAPAPVAAAV